MIDSFKERSFGLYEGKTVPLESPMIEGPIVEEPELNQPKRSTGSKKYVVYVKDPKTAILKRFNLAMKKVLKATM